jgi:hypothetical protein
MSDAYIFSIKGCVKLDIAGIGAVLNAVFSFAKESTTSVFQWNSFFFNKLGKGLVISPYLLINFL